MPINPDAVGTTSEPFATSWTSKDALLYAVGIGAGADELAFTTENTVGVDQQVFPTFAVVIPVGRRGACATSAPSTRPCSSTASSGSRCTSRSRPTARPPLTSRIVGIYDKGKAAVVATETDGHRPGRRAALHDVLRRRSSGARAAGAATGARAAPATSRRSGPPTTRSPTRRARTRRSSTGCRATATRSTPTRSSPPWAASTGRSSTACARYGFTGRALLHTLAGSDPARFHHIEGRFSSPVLPGDALTISMWRTGDGEAVFQTAKDDGTVVIDQGLVRFS